MTEQLIDRTSGTKNGSLFTHGGLAAIFDGATFANHPNWGAYLGGATSAWATVHWTVPKVFSRAKFYGWADRGFVDSTNGPVTLEVRGKNGAFSSETDGVVLGSLTITDTGNESAGRDVVSNGNATAYTDFLYRVVAGSGSGICMGEVEAWEITDGSAPPVTPPPSTTPGDPWIVLCHIGQSHEGGDATIQDQSAYSHRSRIKMLLSGTTTLVPGADPVSVAGNTPFETRNSMGSNMECANELAKLFPDYIVVIAARCKGNTPISEFVKGGALYASAIADWQYLKSIAPAGSIFVFGSWQGESNNGSPSGWPAARMGLAADVRSDLGIPNMLDVIVCCDSRWTGILAQQLGMPLDANTVRVRIDDRPVPSVGDIKDPEVYRSVGRRRASAIAARHRK